jgi:hypothetical protein
VSNLRGTTRDVVGRTAIANEPAAPPFSPGTISVTLAGVSSLVTPAAGPSAPDIDMIERALEALDFVEAARMACLRARDDLEMPVDVCARILPGLRNATLASCLCVVGTGERGPALMTCVESRRFPVDPAASFIEAIVLFAAFRAGGMNGRRLTPELRRLSRLPVGDLGLQLLNTIAKQLRNEFLVEETSHFKIVNTKAAHGYVHTTDMLLSAKRTTIYDALTPDVLAQPIGKHTLRVAPTVGRNAPCPCGSGLKYKRCHGAKEESVAPSPVAGMSWEEFITAGGGTMTAEDISELPLRDLARVDLTTLHDQALAATVRRFTRARLFARACKAIGEVERRGAVDDELRVEVLAEALDANALDTANTQLQLMKDPSKAGLRRLEIDLRVGDRGGLEELARAADAALADDAASVPLAQDLLRSIPALGVLVARGCLRESKRDVNWELMWDIEYLRIMREMAIGDPVMDLYFALHGDEPDAPGNAEQHRANAAASELRTSLRHASIRLHELEEQLVARQAELVTARQDVAARPVLQPAEPRDVERERRLQQKVLELSGLVREGNAERADLRRQLAALAPTPRSALAVAAQQPNHEDTDVEQDVEVELSLTIPNLSRAVRDALLEVQRSVAAEALRTIGALAAGDPATWRRVKQARSMRPQVLMSRVGIHYRLLFRIEAGSLEVLELIQRAALVSTLKRMRTAS